VMKHGGKWLVRFLSNSEFPSYPRCACTAGVKQCLRAGELRHLQMLYSMQNNQHNHVGMFLYLLQVALPLSTNLNFKMLMLAWEQLTQYCCYSRETRYPASTSFLGLTDQFNKCMSGWRNYSAGLFTLPDTLGLFKLVHLLYYS